MTAPDHRSSSSGRGATRRGAALATALVALLAIASACRDPGSVASSPGSTIPETSTSTTSATTSTTTTTTIARWPREPRLPLAAVAPVPVLSRIDTTDPVVFLTIDDGAVRDPRVAQLLASARIPATLFVNEAYYRADPAFFALAASGGGSINSHTRTHKLLTRLNESGQRSEICGMRMVLAEYMPAPGHLMRAPYGVQNPTTQKVAASCGINAILTWRAAINDGRVQFQQGDRLRPGDIVLSHFRPDLYEGLVAFLFEAGRAGLTVAAIEDYLPLPTTP